MRTRRNYIAALLGLALLVSVPGCDQNGSEKDSGAVPPPTGHDGPKGTLDIVTEPPAGLGQFTWDLPAGWQQIQIHPGIVFAQFQTTSDADSARVTLTSLPEQGGDLLININRWREQLKIPTRISTLEEQPFETITFAGQEAALFDLQNDQTGQRILATRIISNGRAWFIKMTGTIAQVEHAKDAMIALAISMQESAPSAMPANHP